MRDPIAPGYGCGEATAGGVRGTRTTGAGVLSRRAGADGVGRAEGLSA